MVKIDRVPLQPALCRIPCGDCSTVHPSHGITSAVTSFEYRGGYPFRTSTISNVFPSITSSSLGVRFRVLLYLPSVEDFVEVFVLDIQHQSPVVEENLPMTCHKRTRPFEDACQIVLSRVPRELHHEICRNLVTFLVPTLRTQEPAIYTFRQLQHSPQGTFSRLVHISPRYARRNRRRCIRHERMPFFHLTGNNLPLYSKRCHHESSENERNEHEYKDCLNFSEDLDFLGSMPDALAIRAQFRL